MQCNKKSWIALPKQKMTNCFISKTSKAQKKNQWAKDEPALQDCMHDLVSSRSHSRRPRS